ncbi:MAG: alpha/beta hydrolase [Bacteroidota bacterium]
MDTNRLVQCSTFLALTVFFACSAPKFATKPSLETSTKDSARATSLGEFELQRQGKDRKIGMSQFRRKALDIAYTTAKNPRQVLDIIYPDTGAAPYKCIVVFHGGGWAYGSKQSETVAPIFQAISQGYAVVSVDYRLADEVTWPKPLHDAKAAIRYVRANAFRHLLDATNIVVWGVASGGHLAEMLAATNNQPGFEDLALGNPFTSSAVQGVVAWYPVSDISELPDAMSAAAGKIMGVNVKDNKTQLREMNPVELVTKDFPPILLVHGTKDQLIPFSQSVSMQQKVNEATGKMIATLRRIEGAVNGDPQIKSPESFSQDLDFVDRILFAGKNPHRQRNYISINLDQ